MDIARQVIDLVQLHDHVCAIYDDPAYRTRTIVPYFAAGLARGEACLLVCRPDEVGEMVTALDAAGVDVARERERGALIFCTAEATYLESGETAGSFSPVNMMKVWRELIETARARGFTGARVAGEPVWAMEDGRETSALLEYEALLNTELFPLAPAVGLCLYNRAHWPVAVIRDVIRTHPTVIVNDEVCRSNLYYERPDLILDARSADERVAWMLQRLREVRRTEEALRQAKHQAEAANRAKDEFLAVLSHELRTPLNAILGWSMLLLRGVSDPDTLRRGLEVIERNARSQTALINDLLDTSRIVRGELKLDRYPVDLRPSVLAAAESVKRTAVTRGVTLTTRVTAPVPLVLGDPDRLQQVFVNLLSNAIKFTSAGGAVTVSIADAGGEVVVEVRDTGEGIAPDMLPVIFERFCQADNSTTRASAGLGLGLALVKHLVEAHEGSVEARSPGLGQGSTFTVRLPAVKDMGVV
jgi:signal transduction histidine kinase